jgi:hypothetical protein
MMFSKGSQPFGGKNRPYSSVGRMTRNPPKAEVTGSNPVGCASYFKYLDKIQTDQIFLQQTHSKQARRHTRAAGVLTESAGIPLGVVP